MPGKFRGKRGGKRNFRGRGKGQKKPFVFRARCGIPVIPTEDVAGLGAHLTSTSGFEGVIKTRYSDFIVNEVSIDNNVVHLKSLAHLMSNHPSPSTMNTESILETHSKRLKLGAEASADTNNVSNTNENGMTMQPDRTKIEDFPPLSEMQLEGLKSIETLTNESIAKEIRKLIHNPCPLTKILVTSEDNKELRTKLFEAVSKYFSDLLMTDTAKVDESNNQALFVRLNASKRVQGLHSTGLDALESVYNKEARNIVEEYLMKLNSQEAEEYAILPPSADKALRKEIHMVIKTHFKGYLVGDTIDGPEGSGTKSVRLYTAGRNRIGRKRSRGDGDARTRVKRDARADQEAWPDDRPPYTRFVLHKCNRDTMTCIQDLSFYLRRNEKMFFFAGTKDKRAVTSQHVTSRFLHLNALKKASEQLEKKGIYIGNVDYVEKPLRLGHLNGNQFTLTIRDVVGSDDDISASINSAAKCGFVNYFGLQRFGTTSVSSHQIGIQMLKGDWKSTFDLILKPRPGDFEDIRKAKNLYYDSETPKIHEALKAMPFSATAEKAVLSGLNKAGANSFSVAVANINNKLRSMYLHAYQSYIFNMAASKRLETYSKDYAVEGDIILIPGSLKDRKKFFSDKDAVEVVNDDDDNNADVNLLKIASEEGDGAASDVSSLFNGNGKYKLVTAEEASMKKYSIYDVMIPIIGSDVLLPSHSIGRYIEELIAKDDISFDDFKRPALREFHLFGTYRNLIQKVDNVSFQVMKYNDVTVPLSETDFDRLDGKMPPVSLEDGEKKAVVLTFSLTSGSYATMFLREVMKVKADLLQYKCSYAHGPVSDASTASTVKSGGAPVIEEHKVIIAPSMEIETNSIE